jgi:N utilization substance protein A
VVESENFVDEEIEIKMEEALELDPDAQVGDFIGIKLDARDLGRIAAQTARQIITQKVRDAEREIIFAEFEQRKGEIASGIARRVERGAIVVDLGRTEAYVPMREQIPGESFKPGDRVQGYISEVRQTTRGPQIIMSRADERYLIKLFEMEVPEIHDGVIEIVAAAREPGSRAKVAVHTNEAGVDPIGACVGMKGSRVQNIVQELKGEKIDIVLWDDDVTRFVCNALAPAEVARVLIDEENREMEVVVPDNQLSLAIGKKGQNVRLAAKLTGWKIDITSESELASKTAEALYNITMIPGVTEAVAQNLYQSGFNTFLHISQSAVSDIQTVPGFDDQAKAQQLVNDAKALVEKFKAEGKQIPTLSAGRSPGEKGSTAAKSLADMRLQQELAKLNIQEQSVKGAEGTEAEAPVKENSDR